MKLRIEMSDDLPCDEVIIRCKNADERVRRLQNAFSEIIDGRGGSELVLTIGDMEYFVPVSDILFFETESGKVAAHTSEKMYFSESKLYELEKILPRSFVRVSKSCVLNSAKVVSISKSLTGSSEVLFANSYKKAYVSRLYYKILKDLIYETRLSK